jgi:D-amino-acid oxidase
MPTPTETDVIVIGAGVSGLTTGVRLAEAGLTVRLLAKDPPGRTTSSVAGASWGPYMVSDSRVLDWSTLTLETLESIASDEPSSGVRLVHGIEAAPHPMEPPTWARPLAGFRICDGDELPAGYVSGWRYRIPLVDMPTYLAYLQRRLAAAGTTVEITSVNTLDEVTPLASVVVNCTGLGARSLVHDDELGATRGQLVVVRNPGIDHFFQDHAEGEDLTYFLPHADHVVLGGSAIPEFYNEHPDPTIAAAIIDRCANIEPKLRHAAVIEHRVGLRPTRPEVRVERDEAIQRPVIHNYGHGGSGLTLSWGCAQEVLSQVIATLVATAAEGRESGPVLT